MPEFLVKQKIFIYLTVEETVGILPNFDEMFPNIFDRRKNDEQSSLGMQLWLFLFGQTSSELPVVEAGHADDEGKVMQSK